MSHEIWVLAERTESGDLAAISRELLGRGRELADAAAVPLAVLVLGAGGSDLARQGFGYGARRAYLIDDALTTQPTGMSVQRLRWHKPTPRPSSCVVPHFRCAISAPPSPPNSVSAMPPMPRPSHIVTA